MKRPTRLSAAFVKTVNRPGRYGDGYGGHGLSLLVKPRTTGGFSKSWSQRLRIGGTAFNLGLGAFPVVTLAAARAASLENARALAEGRDPRDEGRAAKVLTFGEAVEVVISINSGGWRDGAKSANQWRASLRDYAMSRLGDQRVSDITSADVLGVLTPIWNEKPETARRVRQRIGAVMRWAVAQGFRVDNPAGDALNAVLPRNSGPKRRQRALHHSEVGSAIDQIKDADGAWRFTKLSFEFMVLTAARSGEVRGATWDEVDTNRGVWTIPAERMKASQEHRVPLSAKTVDLLRDAEEFADESGLVFPSPRGRPLSDSTLSKLLRVLGVQAVPHGFRSSFRDWCADTGQPREIAEAALAHTVRGVEGAYFRSDLFERRRGVMQAWADYISETVRS